MFDRRRDVRSPCFARQVSNVAELPEVEVVSAVDTRRTSKIER
jgi:hypothetical protein